MKYVVCYSGGHSSSLVAVEAVRKYGKENVILLNHNITSYVEHEDVKRFKKEVANYLDIPITYANINDYENKDQFDVCIEAKAFKVGNGTELCTNRLKTRPFNKWLKSNFPNGEDIILLYGYDKDETVRITRRRSILLEQGYRSDYPLAYWNRTIFSIEEIGIERPITYKIFKHANCIGCLKAGKQSWYVTYCLRPDIWEKAKYAEAKIGYSIIKDIFLKDLEPKFELMRKKGIVPTEKIKPQTFWKLVRNELPDKYGNEQLKMII